MSRGSVPGEVRLPNHEEPIAAVTILDAQGAVVRVVPAAEFRATPTVRPSPSSVALRRRGRQARAAIPLQQPA
jgi:hypothetical protein